MIIVFILAGLCTVLSACLGYESLSKLILLSGVALGLWLNPIFLVIALLWIFPSLTRNTAAQPDEPLPHGPVHLKTLPKMKSMFLR